MLIPVLRICVMFFCCVLFPAGVTQAKCMLVMATKKTWGTRTNPLMALCKPSFLSINTV
jgi:hypothetical protein